MRRSWLDDSACSTSLLSRGSLKPCQNSASGAGAIESAAVLDASANRSGTDSVGLTKSGPTVQADKATANMAAMGTVNLCMERLQAIRKDVIGALRDQLAQRDIEHGGQEQAEQGHADHAGEHGDPGD